MCSVFSYLNEYTLFSSLIIFTLYSILILNSCSLTKIYIFIFDSMLVFFLWLADGDKPTKGSQNKLGSAGLALHYANIISHKGFIRWKKATHYGKASDLITLLFFFLIFRNLFHLLWIFSLGCSICGHFLSSM